MDQVKKNKQFFMRYANAMNGAVKTRELIDQFVSDPKLAEHILFFESVFPQYGADIEELTAEGNRVIAKMRMKCRHEGYLGNIPPTHRAFEVSAVAGYEIENEKIVRTWLISDQLDLMKLLGLDKDSTGVTK
jgi:predicted ester cyclase